MISPAKVTKILKDNLTPILFGILILFVVLSITTQHYRQKNAIKDLIAFAENTTPFIVSQTTIIANESLTFSNNQDSYTRTIKDLNLLIDYTKDRKSKIPTDINDDKGIQLTNLLRQYLEGVYQSAQDLIVQQQTIQSLTSELTTLSQSTAIAQNGSEEEKAGLLTDAQKVFTEVENLKEDHPEIYKYITTQYFSSYDSLVSISSESPSQSQPSSVSSSNSPSPIESVLKLGQKPPLNQVVYPAIKRFQIENQEYLNRVQAMQTLIKDLKVAYNL